MTSQGCEIFSVLCPTADTSVQVKAEGRPVQKQLSSAPPCRPPLLQTLWECWSCCGSGEFPQKILSFHIYRLINTQYTILFLLTLKFCPPLVPNLHKVGFTACSFLDPTGDFCKMVGLYVTSGPKPSSLLWETKALQLLWYTLMLCNLCLLKIKKTGFPQVNVTICYVLSDEFSRLVCCGGWTALSFYFRSSSHCLCIIFDGYAMFLFYSPQLVIFIVLPNHVKVNHVQVSYKQCFCQMITENHPFKW